MKYLTIIAALFAGACGCPVNVSGVDTRSDWTAERDAACAAVEGCEPEFMAQVPVFEDELAEVRDICPDDARGCFCIGDGCPGVIIVANADVRIAGCAADTDNCFYTQSEIVMHEYVHASFRSIGRATADHGPNFELALQRARVEFAKGVK